MANEYNTLEEVWEVTNARSKNPSIQMQYVPKYWNDANLPEEWDLSPDAPRSMFGFDNSKTPGGEPARWDDVSNERESMNRGLRLQSPWFNISTNVEHGGNLSGQRGFISEQQPYLIITTPSMDIDRDNYGHYFGYPSNITTTLDTLSGFTQVGTIHLENIGCTTMEEHVLHAALTSGVIIRSFADTRPGIFTLYTNNSDANVIGKDLTALRTFSDIRLKSATSIVSPTFYLTNIDDIVKDINYIYYPAFNRYYFVNNITSIRDDLWAINCTCDALESWKTKLGRLPAHIERQEYNYNLYLNDSKLRADSRPIMRTLKFPHNFDNDPFAFIVVGYGPHGEVVNE